MPDHSGVHYTKLQAPVDVKIKGGTGADQIILTKHDDSDRVFVTYDSTADVYTITVVNPMMQRVTVKKAIKDDYGVNSFLFTVTLTDSNGDPVSLSNVYGTNGTNAQGKLEFTLVNNQTALLYVPRNTVVRISETTDDRYLTSYQVGNDADHLSGRVPGTSATINGIVRDQYVLFTNTRQKVDVTVEKRVVGNGGVFTFTAQLKENNTAVTGYTLNDNGTPNDPSDDIVTDSNGVATFTLSPSANGTDDIVFTVHKGMSISIAEVTDASSGYATSYTVNGGDPVQGNATGLIRANEDITITFTNSMASIVAPTDVKDNSMILILLMISSATCFAGAVIRNERKKKRGADRTVDCE